MQKGSKSGGGQGSPDRAAEEQATTRGERGFERASRAEILYVHCLRFLSGLFYIVVVSDGFQTSLNTIFTNHSGFLPRLFKPE